MQLAALVQLMFERLTAGSLSAWRLMCFFCQVKRKGQIELACLALHYTWTFGLAFTALPPRQALAFLLLAQMFCGLLLGIVFVQSHNGHGGLCGLKGLLHISDSVHSGHLWVSLERLVHR